MCSAIFRFTMIHVQLFIIIVGSKYCLSTVILVLEINFPFLLTNKKQNNAVSYFTIDISC